jgi:hypothetical protein
LNPTTSTHWHGLKSSGLMALVNPRSKAPAYLTVQCVEELCVFQTEPGQVVFLMQVPPVLTVTLQVVHRDSGTSFWILTFKFDLF